MKLSLIAGVSGGRADGKDPTPLGSGSCARPTDAPKRLPLSDMIDDYRYFFIRGYSRSGTNWLKRLLGLHPRVRCTGEFHLYHVHKQFVDLTRSPYSNLSVAAVRDAAEPYFDAMVKASLLASAGVAGPGSRGAGSTRRCRCSRR